MGRKTCSFCGREYDAAEEKCPACGSSGNNPFDYDFEDDDIDTEELYRLIEGADPDVLREMSETADTSGAGVEENVSHPPETRNGNARKQKPESGARENRNTGKIPKWLVVLTCLILALAVIIVVLFFLTETGVFDPQDPDETSVSLELEKETQTTEQNETEETAPETAADASASSESSEEPTVSAETETQNTVLCTGLVLQPSEISPAEIGERYELICTTEPADCTETVTWESNAPEICSVDEKGIVTVEDAGDDVIITASCGSYKGSCTVKMSGVIIYTTSDPDAEHSLSSTDITFFSEGESTVLKLSDTQNGDQITWTSEYEDVAVVDENGRVEAVGPGKTDVTAELYGKTYTCIIRCNFVGSTTAESGSEEGGETEGTYAISHSDVTVHYRAGETFKLSLSGYDGTVNWTSSDSAVCTVSDGIVTAVGEGTAKVSATVDGVTYTCIVRSQE